MPCIFLHLICQVPRQPRRQIHSPCSNILTTNQRRRFEIKWLAICVSAPHAIQYQLHEYRRGSIFQCRKRVKAQMTSPTITGINGWSKQACFEFSGGCNSSFQATAALLQLQQFVFFFQSATNFCESNKAKNAMIVLNLQVLWLSGCALFLECNS